MPRLLCGATVRGLLLDGDRKSIEPMAARLAPGRAGVRHQQLQNFVTHSRWGDAAVLQVVPEWGLPELLAARQMAP